MAYRNGRVQRRSATSTSIPPPVGGWNARDSLAEMDPKDAVYLTNWFPTPTYVQVRKGYTKFATGLPGQVTAVMPFNGQSTQKLFAASGTSIYDISAGGAVGAAVYSSLTNSNLLFTNMATPGGNFLCMVNGTDTEVVYNGTTWGTTTVTGFTTANASNIYVTKQRKWYIEKNSLRAWYLPIQSYQGAASSLDLSSLCRRGGYLVAMSAWSSTGGFGISDFTCFVTSEGELLVYQGYDPANSANWALQGIYQFGTPMGPKSLCKAGSDVLYISKDGVIPLSQGRFFQDTSAAKGSITEKIMFAISQATSLYPSSLQWQIQPYPLENMILLNVPVGTDTQQQYVMNSITGSWCNFTGWGANCWELYKDNIYFGANGYVGLAWNGLLDDTLAIQSDGKQAFNYFGTKGTQKHWTMIRPIVASNGSPSIYANINVDFSDTSFNTSLSPFAPAGPVWDTAKWDIDLWTATSDSIYKVWLGVNGIGYCASPRLIAATKGTDLLWMATDIVYQQGAVL